MKSTISYGYPYASAGIETALPVIENKSTPIPVSEQPRKCKACSLRERCQPDAANANLHAARAALFVSDA